MQELIITNNKDSNLKHLLRELSKSADRIRVVTAFFSDTAFIIDWLDNSKQVDLIVSLRPPTNYYSLKMVHPKLGINIQFLGDNLHSKFFIFYKSGKPFTCIIGSSNFTSGGLHKNIETNAILTDTKYLTEIEKHFTNLWEQSFLLQPTDLDDFKKVFDNFQKRAEKTEKEQDELQKKILTKRTSGKTKIKICKEAKQYFSFWRIVDEMKEIIKEISEKEYPNIPVYISIDHFWHWVKTVWSKENRPKPTFANRKSSIQKLFKEYCDWDKNGDNSTKKMYRTSKTLFAQLLSAKHIDKLTPKQAVEIFSNLHSTARPIRQFHADKSFIEKNNIQQIRASFKYLLYSNDDIGLRIHNLLTNPKFKLMFLGASGVQEINGWTRPTEYPIRNNKADDGLKLLGFILKEEKV